MPVNLNENRPVDPGDPRFLPLLKNLQGNILAAHGRDFSACCFFRLPEWSEDRVRAAKAWLRVEAGNWITSALQQEQERRRYREFRVRGAVFGTIALSGELTQALTSRELFRRLRRKSTFAGPTTSDQFEFRLFREGMKGCYSRKRTADPMPEAWDPPYRLDLHMLVVLADDDSDRLENEVGRLCSQTAAFAELAHVERGTTLRNESGDPVEVFGFVDGISQPEFLTDRVAAGKGYPAPLSLVLRDDPFVDAGTCPDACASYLVFRKLQQDRAAFDRQCRDLTAHLGHADPELTAAMAMGRYRDGRPVLDPQASPLFNDFDYSADPKGQRCPVFSHIRKANPRRSDQQDVHILRRGVPYRYYYDQPGNAIQSEGLLFQSYQANILNQFIRIQSNWLNSADFPEPATGPDPVLGCPGIQRWPTAWGGPTTKSAPFTPGIRFCGGEYFYVPSVPFFTSL